VSAPVLQRLASAAAATIYDAVGVAETGAELDDLARLIWRGNFEGTICDADAMRLAQYVEQRRPLHHHRPQQITFPGFPMPEGNLRRVGSMRHRSRFPRRREQRSPDKQASYERRHRLAYSGVMPRHLCPRLTIGEMAVMRVIADEYIRVAGCKLSLAAIAARAGGCRKTAKRAIRKARDERLISSEERPVRGERHKPNLIRIISFEWLKWLRRSKDKANDARQVVAGGGHFVSPTDTTSIDDSRRAADFAKTATPPKVAPPQRGQPTKEAIAFADELANIAGYRRATTPASWRKANPPQVVQVWLNELGKYQRDRRPLDVLRAVAVGVMRRKRARDRSPPHSPRYFGSEVCKLIEGMERETRALSEFNGRPMKRPRLQPTRDPTRRVA
jgi:hypothetical protein